MRCHEARKRIDQSFLSSDDIAEDKQLLEHLQVCSNCAQLAQASQLLNRDFKTASVDDNVDKVPLMFLKARVEAQANLNKQKEYSLMTKLTNQLKKRSKFSISLSGVIVALLIFALVPFSINQKVGYEVAFAGVDKDLALNSDKIHEILIKLGIDADATNIEVSGCEETCDLKFTALKSPKDAQLIKAAFETGENIFLTEDITVIYKKVDGSALEHIKLTLLTSEIETYSDGEAHEIVIEKLGENFNCDKFIWFKMDTADKMVIDISGYDVYDPSGLLNIDVHELDEEALQELRDKGYEVKVTESEEDGSMIKKISITDPSGGTVCNFEQELEIVEEEADDTVEKTVAELPEGYALSQNYPNPFNPTTSINYTIPNSEHVTLEIININGQKVKTLVNEFRSAGEHSVEWDATDNNGNKVASGIYLYRFNAGDVNFVKKATLLK